MKRLWILIATLILAAPAVSSAAVTLLDKDEWKIMMSGFAEFDSIYDTTRSFTEVVGNTPVARGGTYNGDNGRTQFSVRNSRLNFTVLAPKSGDWTSKGFLEWDLLGYDPSPAVGTNSESSFYTNPTWRIRHAYLAAENDTLQIVAGQTWTLFGWTPIYTLNTVSVPPVDASLYERTPQVTAIDSVKLSESAKLQAGLSVVRPVQRDSTIPGVDAGLRWVEGSRKAGFNPYNGDEKLEPMSVGVSGTYRQLVAPNSTGTSTDMNRVTGWGISAAAMIPVIADDKEVGNTLAVSGTFTTGAGFADELPSWTGNLNQTATGGTVPNGTPNLDAGQAGYDTSGNFVPVQLQTWSAQLQYHLPEEMHSWINLGYGQVFSSNIGQMATSGGQLTAGNVFYDRPEVYFVNYMHDFTKQLRVGVEALRFFTHYVDGALTSDTRGQISAYFRF